MKVILIFCLVLLAYSCKEKEETPLQEESITIKTEYTLGDTTNKNIENTSSDSVEIAYRSLLELESIDSILERPIQNLLSRFSTETKHTLIFFENDSVTYEILVFSDSSSLLNGFYNYLDIEKKRTMYDSTAYKGTPEICILEKERIIQLKGNPVHTLMKKNKLESFINRLQKTKFIDNPWLIVTFNSQKTKWYSYPFVPKNYRSSNK